MAKGAKKKKVLDPDVELRMLELLGALKSARTIEEYCRALVACAGESEAAKEAQAKIAPPFRTFGGARVDEEGVISWSPTHVLVVEESLADARVKLRRGGEAAPASAVQPRASSNDSEGDEERSSEAGGDEGAPQGADPEAVITALKEALANAKVKHGRITARHRAGGGGCVVLQPAEGPKKQFDIGAANWAEPPAVIARGIVQAMGGEE